MYIPKLKSTLLLKKVPSWRKYHMWFNIYIVKYKSYAVWSCPFSSVPQLCLTLCDPMDCSTPGFPVLQHLLEFTQTHVHWVGDAIQPSPPLYPLLLSPTIIIGHLPTWGVHLSVSYLFAFSYCSWGSQGRNTEVVCHSLLQWTDSVRTLHHDPSIVDGPTWTWLIVSLS